MREMGTIADCIHHTITLLHAQSATSEACLGLVICDDEASLETLKTLPLAEKWTFISLTAFNETEFTQRYDLAVLIFTANLDKSHPHANLYAAAVQRCRDMFAEHSLIFAPNSHDYIAFGFSKIGDEKFALNASKSLIGWQFNLFDYKQLPDWFNSRFWANPENWNKFRW